MNTEICPKCGRKYRPVAIYGDFPEINYELYCECKEDSSNTYIGSPLKNKENPSPNTGVILNGWICPVCGRGVSPFVTYCNHGQSEWFYY